MILVTGANGLLGHYVVRNLLERGERVKCLVHRKSDRLPTGVTAVGGDVRDLDAMRRAVRGVDRVIHLVAIVRERRGRRGVTFQSVNAEGTANVVRAAKEAGVERIVHVSALGATEDPSYRYGHSKWLGERHVVKSGLDWTVVQPSFMYGEGFGFFDRLERSIRTLPPPFVPLPGGGTTRFQPIYAGDVARCVVQALSGGKYTSRVVKLGGPQQFTYTELLDVVLELKGVRRYKLSLPLSVLRPAVALIGLVMRDPPITTGELKQLDVHNITVLDTVERQFGFKPVALRDGLEPLFANRS